MTGEFTIEKCDRCPCDGRPGVRLRYCGKTILFAYPSGDESYVVVYTQRTMGCGSGFHVTMDEIQEVYIDENRVLKQGVEHED